MDELADDLKRAAGELRGHWDPARIERSLMSAKRRRVRRVVVRSSAAALAVLALAFVLLRPTAPQVAQKLPESSAAAPEPIAPPSPVTPAEKAPALAQEDSKDQSGEPTRDQPVPKRAEATPRAQGKVVRVQHASSEFRAKLASGDALGAYAILVQQRPLLSSLDDLMLAADAARRAGDPARAATWLEQAVRDHPGSRSAVAAYTLGKLLQDDLRRPADAARAFALVYARSPDAPLAGEALAREALSLSQAGNQARARTQASAYLARYPEGSQRTRMEQVLRAP